MAEQRVLTKVILVATVNRKNQAKLKSSATFGWRFFRLRTSSDAAKLS
jgi:hypothetical protein